MTSPSVVEGLPVVSLATRRNSRHPWIYRKMCRPATHAPGTLVEVFDREGRFVGRGIYNRKSEIAVRLLTEDPAELLDDAFFDARLDRAISLRRDSLRLETVTNAYRVVNAEGDGLSGLVVDRYGGFVVAQLYSAGWFRKLRWLLPALSRKLGGATVLVKADAATEEREGFRLRDFEAERLGDSRLRTVIREGGLKFHVDLRHGHKTGFFCDQRETRLRVSEMARGLRVLDGCAYTGGFALSAALGGAASVTAVDLDERAVALGRENATLNGLGVDFHHADIFPFLRDARAAGSAYDLIVLDPPKFAAGKSEIAAALKRYRDLNRLALSLLEGGGTLITCSCSGSVSPTRFREAVLQGARDAGARVEVMGMTGPGPDHPVRPEFPEGRYLKVLALAVSGK